MPHIDSNTCRPRPFDNDLPDFAISDLEECITYLKKWARSRKEGKFDIIVGKKQRGPALQGLFNRVELMCSRGGKYVRKSSGKRAGCSKKCNCPWRLSIVQKRIGKDIKWVRAYMHGWPKGFTFNEVDTHGGTHVLDGCGMKGSLLRNIPKMFDDDVDLLIEAGMSPKVIFSFLTMSCNKEGLPVSFVLKDVINRVSKTRLMTSDLLFDITDLVKCLSEQNGIHYAIQVSHEGQGCETDSLFFTMEGSNHLWELCEGKSILLYDTKHGSNRYGFYLGIISTIDCTGKTRILAVSLTKKQDIPTFLWVFKNFKKAFVSSPTVIFTDSDASMIASIRDVFPSSIHLLCVFHIWKNFYQHIMPLLKMSASEDRKKIANKFWKLAKDSDIQMIDEFEICFQSMSNYILEKAKEGNISQVRQFFSYGICSKYDYLTLVTYTFRD